MCAEGLFDSKASEFTGDVHLCGGGLPMGRCLNRLPSVCLTPARNERHSRTRPVRALSRRLNRSRRLVHRDEFTSGRCYPFK